MTHDSKLLRSHSDYIHGSHLEGDTFVASPRLEPNKHCVFLRSGGVASQRSLRKDAWTFDLCIFKNVACSNWCCCCFFFPGSPTLAWSYPRHPMNTTHVQHFCYQCYCHRHRLIILSHSWWWFLTWVTCSTKTLCIHPLAPGGSGGPEATQHTGQGVSGGWWKVTFHAVGNDWKAFSHVENASNRVLPSTCKEEIFFFSFSFLT